MVDSFLGHGNGWNFGATNVHLLGLSAADLACRFQSPGAFRSISRTTAILGKSGKTTVRRISRKTTIRKVLHSFPITFSNSVSSFGSRLQGARIAPAYGKPESMRSSC